MSDTVTKSDLADLTLALARVLRAFNNNSEQVELCKELFDLSDRLRVEALGEPVKLNPCRVKPEEPKRYVPGFRFVKLGHSPVRLIKNCYGHPMILGADFLARPLSTPPNENGWTLKELGLEGWTPIETAVRE